MDVEDLPYQPSLLSLPRNVLMKIVSFLDSDSLSSFASASIQAAAVANSVYNSSANFLTTSPNIDMDCLPSEVILSVFKLLDRQSLGRVAQVGFTCEVNVSVCNTRA
jgi:hypothetical protein